MPNSELDHYSRSLSMSPVFQTLITLCLVKCPSSLQIPSFSTDNARAMKGVSSGSILSIIAFAGPSFSSMATYSFINENDASLSSSELRLAELKESGAEEIGHKIKHDIRKRLEA